MNRYHDNFRLLQLFGEGGAGGAGGDGGAQGGAPAVQGPAGPANRNPLANVVYGKQTEAPKAQANGGYATTVSDAKDSEFEALIKGDYKEQYGQRVKAAIDSRFKASQEKLDRYDKAAPLFELLANKHGVDASDIDALVKAVEDDDSYYEAEALEKGMSVKQLKENKRMLRENEQLKAQMNQADMQKQSEQILNKWRMDADAAKQIYPSLDFEAEVQNPAFGQLLKAGVDVKTAYEVVHKDEIIPNAMRVAVSETERKISNSIAAGRNRPKESAASNGSSTVIKSDVSKLTYADRREIERRLARGERISF